MRETISKMRARTDPVYFAKAFLKVKLHNYQKHVLTTKDKTVVWAAGRGAGKSLVMAILAIHRCFTRKRHIVAYISATQRQGKLFRDLVDGMIAGTPLASSIQDSSYERITFSNGSRLYIYPGGSSVSVRGLHNQLQREEEDPAGITLILDEAAHIPFDTYVASGGVLTATAPGKSQKWIVGSPRGTTGFFFDEYTKGLETYERYTVSFTTDAESCPHINKSVIDEMRAKLPPLEYEAEVRGKFMPALSGFFSGVIDNGIKPYSIPVEYDRDCQYHLGVDLASSARVGSSFFAFVLIERWWGGDRWVVIGHTHSGAERVQLQHVKPYARIALIKRYQYIDTVGIVRELQAIKKQYPSLYEITTETYESTILEYLTHKTELNGFSLTRLHPTNTLQRESFPYFHQLLRDRVLQLPSEGENAKQLLKEMQSFQCKVTDAGNVTYGGGDNEKDDLVYATCWALWQGKERNLPIEIF